MSKPLFIIKHGVAKEVAMAEIDKLCQEKGITDFVVMTEEEFGNAHFAKEEHVFTMPPVPKEPIKRWLTWSAIEARSVSVRSRIS